MIDIQKQTVKNSLKLPQGQKNIKLVFSNCNLVVAAESVIKLYDMNGFFNTISICFIKIRKRNGIKFIFDRNFKWKFS